MRVVKNRARGHGELIVAIRAIVEMAHLPGLPRLVEFVNAHRTATDARQTLRPADALEMRDALLFGREPFDDLKQRRLNRLRGLFGRVFLHDLELYQRRALLSSA